MTGMCQSEQLSQLALNQRQKLQRWHLGRHCSHSTQWYWNDTPNQWQLITLIGINSIRAGLTTHSTTSGPCWEARGWRHWGGREEECLPLQPTSEVGERCNLPHQGLGAKNGFGTNWARKCVWHMTFGNFGVVKMEYQSAINNQTFTTLLPIVRVGQLVTRDY